MKLSTSILSSILLSASLASGELDCKGRRDLASSADVEGTAKVANSNCVLTCKWGFNQVDAKRKLRGNEQRKLSGTDVTGVEKDFLDCTLALPVTGETDEDGNPLIFSYTKDVPFGTGEGWTAVMTKGDGSDRYFSYSTDFMIEIPESTDEMPVPEEYAGCVAKAEIEIEFTAPKPGKAVGGTGDDDEELAYDDSSISVTC